MIRHYILDADNRPVEVELFEWAKFLENLERRRVAFDEVGGCAVSTVFLGLDHRFGGKGPPLLFETMVFPDGDCHRFATWDDALTGHQATVRRLGESAKHADGLLEGALKAGRDG